MIVCATYNIKGGVGKTAAAVNLAWLAARDGRRTLVWDLDPQGAASFYLHGEASIALDLDSLLERKKGAREAIRPTDFRGLDLLPASLAYRNLDLALGEFKHPSARLGKLLAPLATKYDMVFIDCAPNLSLASENVFALADWLLVPVIPTPLSIRAYEQLRAFWSEAPDALAKLLPFFSMVDRRRQLHCELISRFAQAHPEVLRSFVPYTSQVERMGEHCAPIHVFAPSSSGARAFAALWATLGERIGLSSPRAPEHD